MLCPCHRMRAYERNMPQIAQNIFNLINDPALRAAYISYYRAFLGVLGGFLNNLGYRADGRCRNNQVRLTDPVGNKHRCLIDRFMRKRLLKRLLAPEYADHLFRKAPLLYGEAARSAY